jgi:hypothetical protein
MNNFTPSSDERETPPVVNCHDETSNKTIRDGCGVDSAGGELFAIPETKSPRLKWMEKMKADGMLTHYAEHCDEDPWAAIIPFDDHKGTIGDIMVEWGGLYDNRDLIGYGQTESDAMIDCAHKNKLKLWNE